MNFFRSLYNSLFNVQWLRARFLFPAQAWGYFFLLALFLSVFSLIPVVVMVPGAIRLVRSSIETKVPNFDVSVQDGALSVSGIANPYSVSSEESGKNLTLYVDTVATTTFDARELAQGPNGAVILATKDALEIYDKEQGRDQVIPWKNVGDFSFTKQMLLTQFDRYTSPAVLPFIGLLVLVITYVGFVIAKLVSILIVTLIVLVVCRIAGRPWRFAQLYTIGLYAFTLPSLIALVLFLIGLPVASIHFLALLSFMLAIVFTKDRSITEPIAEEELEKKMDLDLEK